MKRRLRLMLFLMMSGVVPATASLCEDVAWDRLVEGMVRGNEGTIASLIGSGRLSLRLDGISQGRYTAQQAKQLLGDFFRRTGARSLSYGVCKSSGNRAWAQAIYRYRQRDTGRTSEERLLLEWCVEAQDALLTGIRSVSVGSGNVIPHDDGK